MHQTRAGVAQIVKADLAQTVALKYLWKSVLDVARLEAISHFVGEHVVNVLHVVAVAADLAVSLLHLTPSKQLFAHCVRHGKASVARLGLGAIGGNDIGLRNARLNFRQIEATHIMENIIYNELRYRGYQVDVGMVESRERDVDGKETRTQLEIDFIATLGSKKNYIQSAYAIPDQAKYEQETASFDKTMDSFKKIVVVEKSMKPRRDEKGYVMIGVKEFLLDKDSLEA